MINELSIPEIQDRALGTLAEQDPEEAVPILLQILDHPRPKIVLGAVRQLEAAGDPVAIVPLRQLESHRSAQVREAAASAVETLSAQSAGPARAAQPQS